MRYNLRQLQQNSSNLIFFPFLTSKEKKAPLKEALRTYPRSCFLSKFFWAMRLRSIWTQNYDPVALVGLFGRIMGVPWTKVMGIIAKLALANLMSCILAKLSLICQPEVLVERLWLQSFTAHWKCEVGQSARAHTPWLVEQSWTMSCHSHTSAQLLSLTMP